jgi:hypothetical protein
MANLFGYCIAKALLQMVVRRKRQAIHVDLTCDGRVWQSSTNFLKTARPFLS